MKQPCGCCTGIEVVTPELEVNRPGLPAIAYRAGTHATFMESMLARLARVSLDVPIAEGSLTLQRIFPLSGLTTRELSDPSIALLDAWATVADVLTFYEERIANEGFLRTAVERRSVLELARLVGYKLRPGVSASVYLAFTVNDGFDGIIPSGTRAQSIPGPGEKPQPFETSENLPAKGAWNSLKPRLTRPQTITLADDAQGRPVDPGTDARTRETLYLQGISTDLKTGDSLLFVFGDDSKQQVLRQIETVEAQAADNRTEVVLLAPPEEETGSTPGEIVKEALDPFLEEAASILADSELAAQIAQTLRELEDNAQAAADTETAARMVAAVVPEVQEKHDIAVARRFTRLEPWLARLLDTLHFLIRKLPSAETTAGGDGTAHRIPSLLGPSPLENLLTILGPLGKPASLQPANAFRLTRSVAEVFSPQSDMAPRLLATFRPAVATSLYKAWGGIQTPVQQVEVFAMRVRTAPFGNNAPLKPVITGGNLGEPAEWPLASADGDGFQVTLDAVYDKVLPNSWVVLSRTDAAATDQPRYVRVYSVRQISRANYGMAAKVTQLFFSDDWLDGIAIGSKLDVFRGVSILAQSEKLELADEPLDVDVGGDAIELAELYDGLESGKWVIVSGERTDIPHTTGVTGSELAMISSVVQGARAPFCAAFPGGFTPFSQVFYTTNANAAGDRLVVGRLGADLPRIAAAKLPGQQYCEQAQLAPGTYVNAYVPSADELKGNFKDFEGLLVDPETSLPYAGGQLPAPKKGSVFAWRISSKPVHTILKLANKLAYIYDAGRVTIFANVVKATHGQTQGEVLGDGDAGSAFQSFHLHQSPLTYLPAPTPGGAESTLVVRVNEVEWHEGDNLFVLGPSDRAYTTQTDDSYTTEVIAGNGEHGRRVPSGTANVKAVYRSGTGKPGNVQAEQISQLAIQPLGVKSVVNPLRASGGADRDSRDQARRNVPIGVLSLDRLVSVADYTDFARRFAGVGKAHARRLSDGRRLLVHLTIAGKDDIPIDPNSDLYHALLQALASAGDPFGPVEVALRRLKVLVISAGVKIDPDYAWETVAAKLRSALLDLYSFDRRELGQSAFLSEAVSVMQAVQGVLFVDMRRFDSVPESVTAAQLAGLGSTLGLRSVVEAELAHVTPASDPASHIAAAEVVLLTPEIPDTLMLTEISR
jgi:hypothetical protein